MVQMQGNQHMGPMNRTMLPPNGPPNMVPGNQQQAHSPNYPQQIGRPSSRPNTPGQGVITNPSPSMAHRLPPGGPSPSISMNELNNEIMRIPNTLLPKLKQELMIPQDKDYAALTPEEKVSFRISQFAYLFIILFSTAFSLSTAEGTATSPSLDQAPLNKHLTLRVLLRHL